MNNRVCVFLAPGYEEIEALTPINYLRRANFVVDIVSTTDDIAVEGAHRVVVQTDTFIDDIRSEEYAMLVIPGGLPGAPNLAANSKVIKFVQEMHQAEKFIAAICAGPTVLEKAGILKGRCTTCYPGVEEHLPSIKEYQREMVVRDGHIITGAGPGASGYFALALIEALAGKKVAEQIAKETIMDIVEENFKK